MYWRISRRLSSKTLSPNWPRPRKLPRSMITAHQVGKEKQRKRSTEIEPSDERTIENYTEKPTGTNKALVLSVAKKKQTSMTKPRPVVHFGFDDQLGHKLSADYMEPWMNNDEVSRFWMTTVTVHHTSVTTGLTTCMTKPLLFLCFLFQKATKRMWFCQKSLCCFCAI